MARRSAPDNVPAANPRPKGRTTTTAPRTRTKAGPVEAAVARLVTEMTKRKLLPIAGAVTAAQATAAARALDQALDTGNAYGCRQAHLSLTECLVELRKCEPVDVPDDPVDLLLRDLSRPTRAE
jgi:hypothetical protein